MTGFMILGVLIGWWALFAIFTSKRKLIRYGVLVFLVLGVGAIAMYLKSAHQQYFHVKDDLSSLPERSAGGELYSHHPENKLLENGHYVWTGIARNELSRSWNQRSSIHIDSLGKTKQVVGATLIRYLSSKGLMKDSVSVYQLSPSEIAAIENGQATAYPEQLQGIRGRLNKIFFEYDNYRNGGDPSGNSVVQRFEFWRAAVGIIRENPWIGVGTGDLKSAYALQYEKMKTALDPSYRLRAHNQYLTYAVTYGIFGLLLFVALLLIILFDQKKHLNFLFMSYFLITILSFLTEDTLETQAGVAFVVVWGVVLGGMKEWGEK
jgi:O-Antigen ligase